MGKQRGSGGEGGGVTQSVVWSWTPQSVPTLDLFLCVSLVSLLFCPPLWVRVPLSGHLAWGQCAFPGLVGLVFQAGGRVGEELAEGEGFM